jgi:hypothetical protein
METTPPHPRRGGNCVLLCVCPTARSTRVSHELSLTVYMRGCSEGVLG